MSIKMFNKGLGLFTNPFDATGQTSTADVQGAPIPSADATLVVDHTAQASLGSETLLQAPASQQFVNPAVLPLTFPQTPTAIPATKIPRPVSTVGYLPAVQPDIYSATSGPAPYETLFSDFDIRAFPTYNYWTADERTNDVTARGTRKLSDVPRYITVNWLGAPDIQPPSPPPRVSHKAPTPIKFTGNSENNVGVTIKGIAFAPDHLQPSGFSHNRQSVANGYIAPGTLETIVELPLNTAGIDSQASTLTDPAQNIDEDTFLDSDLTSGVSIHELQAQINQLTNPVLGTTDVLADELSAGASADAVNSFAGKFSVSKPISSTGQLQIQSNHGSLPPISLVSQPAVGSEPARVDQPTELASKLATAAPVSSVERSAFSRVKFVDPAIGGVISPAKTAVMTRPEHAESMTAVAQILPNLEVLSRSGLQTLPRNPQPPSFSSPAGLPDIQYIGYLLEKYGRTSAGVWQKLEEVEIPSVTYDEYIDTKVLYGETYRYRVKTFLRWTHPRNVGLMGADPTVIPQSGSHTTPVAPNLSNYFYGEWSQWIYATVQDNQMPAPPDQLSVRPDSARQCITVTFTVPYNPKRDIYQMKLFRKLQDENGNDLTGWSQLTSQGNLNELNYAPQNVIYIDTNVQYFQTGRVKYVYAAQCYSRHGGASAYSDQVQASLNSDWQTQGEYDNELVSCAGVKTKHFGSFSVYPMRTKVIERILKPTPDTVAGSGQPSIAAFFRGRETIGNTTMIPVNYIIRVTSLDTGETKDLPFNIDYNNLKSVPKVLNIGVYVPSNLASRNVNPKNLPNWKTPSTTGVVRPELPEAALINRPGPGAKF